MILQSKEGVDVLINGIEADGQHALWFGRTLAKFDDKGSGPIRFYRPVDPEDDEPLLFCPGDVLAEAAELMKKAPQAEWYTFHEAKKYIKSLRQQTVEHKSLLLLDEEHVEAHLSWSETKSCIGAEGDNVLVKRTISPAQLRELRKSCLSE